MKVYIKTFRNRKTIPWVVNSLSSISLLWVGSVLGGGFGFLTQIVLTRCLPIVEYGAIATACSFVSLFAPLAGFGVGQYWLRLFAREGWGAQRWLKPSMYLAILTTTGTICLLLFGAGLGKLDDGIKVLICLLLPLVPLQGLTTMGRARLQLEGRYGALSLWEALPHSSRLVVAVVVSWAGLNVIWVGVGYSVVALILGLAYLILLWQMMKGHFRLQGHQRAEASAIRVTEKSATMKSLWSGSWPFGLAGVFYLIYYQSDIVFLGWMKGAESVAVYNVAFVIISAVHILPSAVFQKFLLPHVHRWAEHDRARFLRVYRFGNGIMLATGFAMMLCIMLCAFWIVPLIFGAQYANAAHLLLVLSVCIPFRFLSTSIGSILLTANNMRKKIKYQGSAALINILLNFIFIPKFDAYGAALSTVITEICLLLLYLLGARNHVFGLAAWRGWTVRLGSLHEKECYLRNR